MFKKFSSGFEYKHKNYYVHLSNDGYDMSDSVYDRFWVHQQGNSVDEIPSELKHTLLKRATYTLNGYSGIDPEVFIIGKEGLLPAQELMGYLEFDKFKQIVTGFTTTLHGGSNKDLDKKIYPDGVAMEFQTPPIHCHAHIVDFTAYALNTLWSALEVFNEKHGTSFELALDQDLAYINPDALPPNVLQLGCSPSLNAYTSSPPAITDKGFRTTGFHYHYTVKDSTSKSALAPLDFRWAVKVADFAQLLVLLCTKHLNQSPLRRTMYGRAGEYRLPKHRGVEYRTSSSVVLANPLSVHLVMDLTRLAIRLGLLFPEESKLLPKDIGSDKVQEAINNVDFKLAAEIVSSNSEFFEFLTSTLWDTRRPIKTFISAFNAQLSTYKSLKEAWRYLDWKSGGFSTGHTVCVKEYLS